MWLKALVILLLVAGVVPAQEKLAKLTAHPTGPEALLLGIARRAPGHAVVVGGTGPKGAKALIRTTNDAGRSWSTPEGVSGARLYDVSFPSEDVGWAAGLEGTLLRTTDRAVTWKRVEAHGTRGWLASVFFVSVSHGFLAGGEGEGMLLLRTRDAGKSWQSLVDRVPESARAIGLRDLHFVDAQRGFAVGEDGLVLKTEDGGDSWTRRDAGTKTWLRSLSFPTPRRGFIAAADGHVLCSDDGGATWRRRLVARGQKLNAVAFFDRNRGFVTTMQGALYETRDAGKSWTRRHTQAEHLVGISAVKETAWIASGDGRVVVAPAPRKAPPAKKSAER